MRIRNVIAILMLALTALPALAQQDLPYGWHKPRKAELGKRGNRDLSLKADFDGDGKPDTAMVLADDRGGAVGVFAFATSTSRWFKLDSEAVAELQHWRIKVAAPGSYDLAPPPGSLKTARAAVFSFLVGRTLTLFYWDPETKTFKHASLMLRSWPIPERHSF